VTIRRFHWARMLGLMALVVLAMQAIPYGRDHTNPPIVAEPQWDTPQTRALAKQACFDCHSNETQWPWYANVAPVSWLVQRDVNEGRAMLNFSEWQRQYEEAGEAAEEVLEREMPPAIYRTMHLHAQLAPDDRMALARGLTRTLGLQAAHK
jgi:mono/diheme cytochrome c family protein